MRYGGGHIGASLAQRLGLWDDFVVSGIGGTGWKTGGATEWASSARIQDFIDTDADICLFMGSQNDAAGTTLQNGVTTTLDTLLAAKPAAYIVGVGNIMGASTAVAASLEAGFNAAADQRRVRFINNQSPTSWVSSLANPNWTVTSDANHFNQEGEDYFEYITTQYVAEALLDMVLAR